MKKLLSLALLCSACGNWNTPVPGSPGLNGSSCTTITLQATLTAPGGAEILCTDGTSSFVSNGVNGQAGVIGTPVQFCKNPVTSYPSTFAEVGFCINGSIYAVYSANDGFLTLIPNGVYDSNGINASCSFTVTGCTISNQSN